jgi:ATP-binding cassette subfamily B protein
VAQILMSVMMAALLFAIVPRALVCARRVEELLRTPSSVCEPATALPRPARSGHGGVGEGVVFQGVGFCYPGAPQATLVGIDLRIEPGQTVAVIGATGSGKSTLLSLVPRLFDTTSGSVSLGGVDVRALSLPELWGAIGLVPQQAYLFTGTIASNLRLGRAGASEAELWQALEVAQASSFVAALPLGLQTPVAQGGGNFSGGQRQRLTIARALVGKPRVYLMDDSFSALDYATDARLRLALRPLLRDACLLLVGQRVSAVQQADRIVLLDGGTVLASGTHASLLQNSSAYRDIVASQRDSAVLP